MSCWKLGGFESVNFRPSQMQKISGEPLADAVRMVKKNGVAAGLAEAAPARSIAGRYSGLFPKRMIA